MQINDIFHNCPQEQQQQQQSNPKDLGSKCPRSKKKLKSGQINEVKPLSYNMYYDSMGYLTFKDTSYRVLLFYDLTTF